jgi:hypothetical protein
MAKVIESLITGIGFIGGGAILKLGDSVHGPANCVKRRRDEPAGVAQRSMPGERCVIRPSGRTPPYRSSPHYGE